MIRSRMFWKNAYSGGTKTIPMSVDSNIPQKVDIPIALRLPAPAPVATTIGNTPMMNDHAVINTER